MKKITYILISIGLVAYVAYRLYSNKQRNAAEVAIVKDLQTEVAVRVASVNEEKTSELFIVNGTFQAEQDLNVSAEIGGQVQQIVVKEGDFVHQGQVLAYIKADRVNVGLEQAKAVLSTAQADLVRFENAFKTGGVTQQQLEQVRLQVKNAQANFNSAQISSGDTSVKSKISGIVSSKNVEEGTVVGAGTPLFNVVNIDQVKLVVNVDESQISKLKIGQKVSIKPSASDEVSGKITFIAPKSNGALKFPVEISVENKNRILKAGMYATAKFAGNENDTPILVVPRTAFVGSVSQNKIFRVVNGKAELVSVVSGRNFGEKVEILQGLSKGDQVVTSGQINLENNTPVKIVQ